MTKKDFLNMFENGFELNSVRGNDSQLRCFVCHERTELKKINRKWKVRCGNRHTFQLIDYTVLHTESRDGLLRKQLEKLCMFGYQK